MFIEWFLLFSLVVLLLIGCKKQNKKADSLRGKPMPTVKPEINLVPPPAAEPKNTDTVAAPAAVTIKPKNQEKKKENGDEFKFDELPPSDKSADKTDLDDIDDYNPLLDKQIQKKIIASGSRIEIRTEMSQNPKILDGQGPKDPAGKPLAGDKNVSVGKETKKKRKSLILEKDAETYVADSMRKPSRGNCGKIKEYSVHDKRIPSDRKSTYF